MSQKALLRALVDIVDLTQDCGVDRLMEIRRRANEALAEHLKEAKYGQYGALADDRCCDRIVAALAALGCRRDVAGQQRPEQR